MRSLVFRFRDVPAFSAALADAHGSLPLPEGETVQDGEWVLAIFEIGSRKRATAAAARGVRAAGDDHIEFERRDWERLLAFALARSEHMRAAKPVSLAPVSSSKVLVSDEVPMSEVAPSSAMAESSRLPLGARVLLVDDDEDTRDEVSRMLAEIGLTVEIALSASEASARMKTSAFDALVLDFHAPGMDPIDFVRGLRRDPKCAPLPVLVLSERPSSRDLVDAFASGADDFLPKPFRAPELGARIFGLLRRARMARHLSGNPGPG